MVQRRGARALRSRGVPRAEAYAIGQRKAAPRGRRSARRKLPWRSTVGVVTVAAVVLAGTFVLDTARDQRRASTPEAPSVSETAATMLRLNWHPVAGTDHYEVLVRPAAPKGADKATQDAAEADVVTLTTDSTEVQVPRLSADAEYEVSVRSVRTGDSEDDEPKKSPVSPWTPTTTAPSDDPELLVPREVRTDSSQPQVISAVWEAIESATSYEVQISRSPDFDGATTKKVDEPTATFENLFGGVDYHLRLRAVGDDSFTGGYTEPIMIRTLTPDETPPIRVATFNVQCHKCGGPSWAARRGNVAATIAQQAPDVIGLQEALEHGAGSTQYGDLRGLIASQGVEYTVSDTSRLPKGVRIFYRSDRLALESKGTHQFANQKGGAPKRQAAWALFTQRSTGKRFLFVSLHLEPNSKSVQVRQANEIARLAPQWADGAPIVVVGDFNASQFSNYAVHRVMTGMGLVNPLGLRQSSRSPAGVVAENTVHANRDSFNYGRAAPPAAGGSQLGSYIDNIFTSEMRILEFENVARVGKNGRFIGPASDHNMLRADIVLPD